MPEAVARAVIGLGANLGDALGALRDAVSQLARDDRVTRLAASSAYSSTPVGGPEQPDYFNAVVEVLTTMGPYDLLEQCHAIENSWQRAREVRWGPRTLDLDVLCYWPDARNVECLRSDDPHLTLPHPRASERGFVLFPWAELAPDDVLDGLTVRERAELVGMDGVRKLADHRLDA